MPIGPNTRFLRASLLGSPRIFKFFPRRSHWACLTKNGYLDRWGIEAGNQKKEASGLPPVYIYLPWIIRSLNLGFPNTFFNITCYAFDSFHMVVWANTPSSVMEIYMAAAAVASRGSRNGRSLAAIKATAAL